MLNDEFKKGDAISLEATFPVDVTGWKIRCEIYDGIISIKLATVNSGGSDDQIKIESTTATKSVFAIQVPSGKTKNFKNCAKIEIRVETDNIVGGAPEVITVLQDEMTFLRKQIDWEDPTA